MRRERPTDLLRDILEFIDKASDWSIAPNAMADERTLYAVLHAIQYFGEAASRLPPEGTSLAPDVPWQRIRAMRNLIAHDYAGVDAEIVRKTVEEWLPELKVAVTSLLTRLTRA